MANKLADKTISTIPNMFYDLIAYFFSGSIFFFLVLILSYPFDSIIKFIEGNTNTKNIIIILLSISFIYIWGQVASTFSSYLVKKPITFLLKRILKKVNDGFFFKHDELLKNFSILEYYPEKLKGNYWTILYYIFLVSPNIGLDLMKRYARCKLARINSFNFLLLGIYSLLLLIFNISQIEIKFLYSLILFFLTFIMYCDYYQRQKWFNDIIIKIFASVYKYQNSLIIVSA